jgi:hypothetical protein
MEKKQPSYTADGNVNYHNHYEKQYGDYSKLKIKLTYDPEILLLGCS